MAWGSLLVGWARVWGGGGQPDWRMQAASKARAWGGVETGVRE